MLKIIRTDIPNVESYFGSHPLEIIEELLSHLWDVATFRSYFETDIEFVVDEHTINYDTFKKSLTYIQVMIFYDLSMRIAFQMSFCSKLISGKSHATNKHYGLFLRNFTEESVEYSVLVETGVPKLRVSRAKALKITPNLRTD